MPSVTYHAGTYTPTDLPEDNVVSMLALGYSDTMALTFAVTDFYMTDPEMMERFKRHRYRVRRRICDAAL